MATILVTGATGTVMKPVCDRLLKEGHERHTVVALVRPAKGSSPNERLQDSLQIRGEGGDRLFVLSGDITQPLAGVSLEDQRSWQGKIDKVLHGAASIKFVETPDNQVFTTNVLGTQNMLHLAGALGVSEFHYVSTAYVAGNREEFSEDESPWNGSPHRNAYERSKAEAEELVHSSKMGYSIYRIPIVVGDSCTGEIGGFTGYYGFLAPFWQLRNALLTKLQKDGAELNKEGVWLDTNSFVNIPLSIPCSKVGPLNIVPADWLSKMLTCLMGIPAANKAFHLTNPDPPRVQEMMVASLAALGFRGIACGVYPPENMPGMVGRFQRSILKQVDPYLPYISKDREVFDSRVAQETLGEVWCPSPDIGPKKAELLLGVAKTKNFGRS